MLQPIFMLSYTMKKKNGFTDSHCDFMLQHMSCGIEVRKSESRWMMDQLSLFLHISKSSAFDSYVYVKFDLLDITTAVYHFSFKNIVINSILPSVFFRLNNTPSSKPAFLYTVIAL